MDDEISPFKPLSEALKYIRLPKFRPELATRRFRAISKNLEKTRSLGFLGAIVIYGLRRVGKTVSVVELAKKAQQAGYSVFYTDLDNPVFDESGESMKTGKIIKAANYIVKKYKNRKLLVVVDEAFVSSVRVIHKFLEAFKPLYDEERDFGVILLGSYGTDIERLRAYLYRTIPAKGIQPMIIATPFLCISNKRIVNFEVDLIDALTKPPDSPIRLEVMRRLIDHGLYLNGRSGAKAKEILRDYLSSAGMPEAILGIKDLNELTTTFYHLLEESVYRFKSVVEAAKDEKIKYKAITFKNVVNELVEIANTFIEKPPEGSRMKLREFVLNLGLLIPRRYIERPEETNRERLLLDVTTSSLADIMGSFKAQPIPAHYFAYLLIEGLAKKRSKKFNTGAKREAIVAHALIMHASSRSSDASMARLPIFSAPGIDFLYVYRDVYGEPTVVLIEVKTGERIKEIIEEGYDYGSRSELDRALSTAAQLGKPLVLVTDHEEAKLGEKALIVNVEEKKVPVYVLPVDLFIAGIGCEKISPASRI